MSNEEKKIHEVEINLPVASPSKDFTLKIDGKIINGVRDVKVSAPFMDATTITIEMLASVKGKIEVEDITWQKEK